MNDNEGGWFLAGFIFGAFVSAIIYAITILVVYQNGTDIPDCREDEVIHGVGDFDDGRWELYKCIPVDDLIQ